MDRPSDFIVAALRLAEEHPLGLALYRSGKSNGLFPPKVELAGEAANFALDQGLLQIVKESNPEVYRATPKGIAWLDETQNPKEALEKLLLELATHESNMPVWLADLKGQLQALTQKLHNHLEEQGNQLQKLRSKVETALLRLEKVGEKSLHGKTLAGWQVDAIVHLERLKKSGATQCSLADLYKEVHAAHPELSLPEYHAGLLLLRDHGSVTLLTHPGPIRELAEPEFALMDGPRVYAGIGR